MKLPSGSVKSWTRATNRVPAIVGGVLGSVAGIGVVILLVFLYLAQRHRKEEEAINGDQHSPMMIATGPSLITPFMSSKCDVSGQPEDLAMPGLVSPVQHPEKLTPNRPAEFSMIQINSNANIDPESSNIVGSRSRNAGMSPQDNDIRQEVEQLRVVVEMLRDQQVSPPQIVDQDLRSVPDEPPPSYGPPAQS